jgi:intracellular septation protein A
MTHSDASPATTQPDVSVSLVLPPLVFDLALPVLTYFVLTGFGVTKLLALCAGGLFPTLNIGRTWIQSRRIQPLSVIVIAFIAIGTAAALVSGSVFVALIKDFLLAATFGFLCLGSMFVTARPLMFYLLRQFIAGEDPGRLQWWEGLWERAPFRAALQRVTAVWGIGYVLQAAIGIACASWLEPAQVVIISPVMALGVLGALAAWTRWYLLGLRAQHGLAAPAM